MLSMTVDFFGDGGRGLYTPRTLDLMMREARCLGIRRVYWQYLGDLGAGSVRRRDRHASHAMGEVRAPHAGGHRASRWKRRPWGRPTGGEWRFSAFSSPITTGMSATFPEGSPESDPTHSNASDRGQSPMLHIPSWSGFPTPGFNAVL